MAGERDPDLDGQRTSIPDARPRSRSGIRALRVSRRRVLTGLSASAGAAILLTADRSAAGVRVATVRAGDSTADRTAALNRAIAAAPDGSTLRFPRGASYRVDGTLHLNGRHDLELDGNGATLYSTVTSPLDTKPVTPMFDILGGSNLSIRNFRLQATNPAPRYVAQREWQPFIDVHGTQGLLIEQIDARGSWGDFVHLTPDTRPDLDVMARGITVRNCRAQTIGRNQISFTGCQDVVVESCVFDGTGFQVFDVEVQAQWWNARRLSIQDNIITGRVSLSVLVSAGLGTDVRDVRFTGNVMRSTSPTCEPPIHIVKSGVAKAGWTIHDNDLRTLSSAARVAGVEQFSFENNRVSRAPGGGCRDGDTGVTLRESSYVSIRGNDFAGGYQRVVPDSLVEVMHAEICDNRVDAVGSGFDQPTSCP